MEKVMNENLKIIEQFIDMILKENKHLDEVNRKLMKENKQLKEQLLVSQTNEETFRLEMEDITKILGLDENTLFDDVKLCVKSLKEVSE